MNIGSKIKAARIAKGLTQEELGHMLGVEKSAVAKYEKGRVVNLKQATLKKLSEILDVSISEMFDESNEMFSEQEADPLTDIRAVFSKNLRTLVTRTGKFRKEVSEDIGVSYSTFSEWCTGKKYPRPESLEALARYFGVSVLELIGEQKSEPQGTKSSEINKDAVLGLILRLHTDAKFFDVVEKVNALECDKLNALRQLLNAFGEE